MNGVVLTQAFDQWANRPKDERFTSIADLDAAVRARYSNAIERTRPWQGLKVAPQDGRLALVGANGAAAKLNSWSVSQLCSRLKAPAEFITEGLSLELASDALNYRLARLNDIDGDREVKLLLDHKAVGDGYELEARALTGVGYARIWDKDITERLIRLTTEQPHWQPAPAAFDGSRGLYAGDRDVFAFLVDNERRIFEEDKNGGLGRFVMYANSEVGKSSFWRLKGKYEYVCGNHRVWGATEVTEIRIAHRGDALDRVFGELEVELKRYAEGSAAEEEAEIRKAKAFVLGATKEEVLDKVFGLRLVSRKVAAEAYAKAEEHEDWYGAPNTAWGFTGGLTEIARDYPNADKRTEMDRAAGKIVALAF